GLAQCRGRNADRADRAVRDAESRPAHDAHAQHEVDQHATDPADLPAKLDGRTNVTSKGPKLLHTHHPPLEKHDTDCRTQQ
ncbi:nodulation protein NfeD, partial [Burkholderia pseudomallei]